MVLILLAILDILAGITLLFPEYLSSIAMYVGIIVLVKGVISYAGGVAKQFYFDWMGIVDILTGIFILVNLQIPFFWLIPCFKGIYTVFLMKLSA